MLRDHSIMKRLLLALACLTSLQAAETYTEKPGKEGDGAFEVGPEYKLDPDLTDKGNAKGKTFTFSMKLADSKIFDGTDKTLEPDKKKVNTERKITVYVPAAYQDGTKAPLLVIHDGPGQLKSLTPALSWISRTTTRQRKRSIRSARGSITPA
jgi:hypothetical protein